MFTAADRLARGRQHRRRVGRDRRSSTSHHLKIVVASDHFLLHAVVTDQEALQVVRDARVPVTITAAAYSSSGGNTRRSVGEEEAVDIIVVQGVEE